MADDKDKPGGLGGIFNKNDPSNNQSDEENRQTFSAIPQTDQNKPANESEKAAAHHQAEVLTESGKRNEAGAAAVAAVEAGIESAQDQDQPAAIFSSHPIQRLRIGRFQFEKGVLKLQTAAEVEQFEKLLETAAPQTKLRVQRIDRQAAEQIAAAFRGSRLNRGIDTSRPGPSGGAA